MNLNATDTLLRALDDNRLPHGILLHGPDLPSLHNACAPIATRLLGLATDIPFASHPDCHAVRPSNKMRRISVDTIRELNGKIQKTTAVALRKVAVIYDADRLSTESANAFLKTLEEPPADTTIFLLTTRPAQILDTIRSRCLLFHVPPDSTRVIEPSWAAWLAKLDAWITDLISPAKFDKERVASIIFAAHGLASGFDTLLASASDREWAKIKPTLPEETDEDEQIALETGVRKNIRSQRYVHMAELARDIAARHPNDNTVRALHQSLRTLQRTVGLLEANLSDSAAIEHILLTWLRLWSAAR